MPFLTGTINNSQLTINKRRGFTLIELLVAIALVGILSSFVTSAFISAQKKGRDSRRKGDLDAIKKTLELAKTDSTGGAYYPGCSPAAASCSPTATTPALATTYIKTVPGDPSGGNYTYRPLPASCTSSTCTTFELVACLENASDPQKESTLDAACSGKPASYQVDNP